MKKLIPLFSIVLLMTACNQSVKENAAAAGTQQVADTTGLASYTAWKAQNELASLNATAQSTAPEKVRTIVKRVPVATRSSSTSTSSSNSGKASQSGSMNSETAETAKAQKKTGWSKAAKGAVIGGVAGAAGGAIINKKNRVLGAVIGGVVGAAGGYGIGRTMDKKDGRIEYALN
jgi:hypothetical protein